MPDFPNLNPFDVPDPRTRAVYQADLDREEMDGTRCGYLTNVERAKILRARADRLDPPMPAKAAAPVDKGTAVFLYTNYRDKRSIHTVRVLDVRVGISEYYKRPQLLLRGLDVHRGEEREFAVSRIDWDWQDRLALKQVKKLCQNFVDTGARHPHAALAQIEREVDDALSDTDRRFPDPASEMSGLFPAPLAAALIEIGAQVQKVAAQWPTYSSAHEALGVLLEEVREFEQHVFTKQSKRDLPAMRAKAMDIAATGLRIAMDTCTEERGRK